jgi:2-polyprenyl-3-methyl-5-hydroxy-6-metoxy-1,4-benzoquinol methylase
VLCELLEHVSMPQQLLAAVSARLGERGAAFVTMAINLAQEDHVYWYRDLEACRAQIAAAGLRCLRERFISVAASERAIDAAGADTAGMVVGNYVAGVTPC